MTKDRFEINSRSRVTEQKAIRARRIVIGTKVALWSLPVLSLVVLSILIPWPYTLYFYIPAGMVGVILFFAKVVPKIVEAYKFQKEIYQIAQIQGVRDE